MHGFDDSGEHGRPIEHARLQAVDAAEDHRSIGENGLPMRKQEQECVIIQREDGIELLARIFHGVHFLQQRKVPCVPQTLCIHVFDEDGRIWGQGGFDPANFLIGKRHAGMIGIDDQYPFRFIDGACQAPGRQWQKDGKHASKDCNDEDQ